MTGAQEPVASVVITSRNRKDDLLEAIASCLAQTAPIEVLYLDDASEDESHLAVKEKFPAVRIFREEQRRGLIVLRNRGARLARSNYIFSIDDDAIFTSPHIVEQTLSEFDHPRIGAVAIPFKNIRTSNDLLQRAPNGDGIYVTSMFIGTAHALRRDLFLRLGGYRESFVHQAEEMDYCIRMLEAGYVVRLGKADEIHHFVSPKRDMTRIYYYETRNTLLFYWFHADHARLSVYLAGATVRALANAVRISALRIKTQGLIDAVRYVIANPNERRPVSAATLSFFRKHRTDPIELSSIVERLPDLRALEALPGPPLVESHSL